MPDKRGWRRGYTTSEAETTAAEYRHKGSLTIRDDAVLQVSRFKWLVTEVTSSHGVRSVRSLSQYTVTRDEELAADDEDRDKDDCKKCEYRNLEYDHGNSDGEDNESYCEPCDICACYYTCNCSDGHTLCEHVHKVHTLNGKLIEEQGPRTLEKSIEDRLATVNAICKEVLSSKASEQVKGKREELHVNLEAVANKFLNE